MKRGAFSESRGGSHAAGSSLLFIAFMLLCGAVVYAQAVGSLHMSLSPDGGEVTSVRSETAKVYAVLSYQEAADTELKVRVYGADGVIVLEQVDVYNGSGQRGVEITGQDILSGYVSEAREQSDKLVSRIEMAQQATSASAKRLRVPTDVLQTLSGILTALQGYPFPLATLDELETARSLVTETRTKGLSIVTDVPDEDLDSALAELETQITETVGAVEAAVSDIDTDREWGLVKGAYITTLYQNGDISDSAEWEVSPAGEPGTPVAASPTGTIEPTETSTPTETPEPTATVQTPTPTEEPSATLTERSATFTPRFTPTMPPSQERQEAPTATPGSSVQGTPQAGPPTATATTGGGGAPETEPPRQMASPVTESDTGYPEPGAVSRAGPEATPVTERPAQGEAQPRAETAESEDVGEDTVRETPLPPQEAGRFPFVRIMAIVSALALGLVAFWLRANI